MASEGGARDESGAEAEGRRARHPCSFKLRFAAVREPGRSYVSPVKPRALPATVTGKFYARTSASGAGETDGPESAALERAVRRVRDMFAAGPRDRLAAPLLSSHEYGWWWEQGAGGPRGDRRLHHHIRDSAWLRERLRLLAARP